MHSLHHYIHFAISLMLLLFIAVILLIAIALLVLLVKKLLEKAGAKAHGLLQVHRTTKFEKTQALRARLYKQQGDLLNFSADLKKPIEKLDDKPTKPVMVVRFDGDLIASARKGFAQIVDEILANVDRLKSVVVVVSSPGGGVTQYGQMFSEMERIRNSGLTLDVCVDTYAASGGYLMSLPATKIIAAPYAMVGSIGVVTEFVNASKFLRDRGLEPLTFTAGKYKRTITALSDVTEDRKQHLQDRLEAIHRLFIQSATKYRKVDADKVCTGDFWTAEESVQLGLNLVDEIGTSQDFLFKLNQLDDLIFATVKKNWMEQGALKVSTALVDYLIERLSNRILL